MRKICNYNIHGNFHIKAHQGNRRNVCRCNRLKCPLAKLSGLQCFNMGHNGHGINLYGVVMILMGNLHAGGQSNLVHHLVRGATGVPRAPPPPPRAKAKVVSKWPYESPLSESGCSHQNNLDRKHLICIKQDGRRKNYDFTFFVISPLIDGNFYVNQNF